MVRLTRLIRALLTLAIALPLIGVGCAGGDKSNPMGADTNSSPENASAPLSKPALTVSNKAESGNERTLIPTSSASLLNQGAANGTESATQSNQQSAEGQDANTTDEPEIEADDADPADAGKGR